MHCLGENGAGKSTLMNVLAGLYHPESGEIFVDGERVSFHSPQDAIAHGIGMVHQHFMLVPSHTVAENMVLGLDQPRFFLNLSRVEEQVTALGEQYGLSVNPRAQNLGIISRGTTACRSAQDVVSRGQSSDHG